MKSRARRTRLHGALRRWPSWLQLRRLLRGMAGAVCGGGLAVALWQGVPPTLHWIKTHPYFALSSIELDGNRRLSRAEILDWIGIGAQTSVWDVPPHRVRARLLAHAWIREAGVRREFPNRLTLAVSERRPAAIVRLNGLQYVDRVGHLLGPLRGDDSRDFPVITGFEGPEQADFASVGMHRALQLLRRCERLSCFDAVSEVHVDREKGLTVFPLRTAVAVVLGWGGWREKLARSARVFAAWEGQVERLAAVDVSFRDLVVVKLRVEERPPTAVRAPKRGMRV